MQYFNETQKNSCKSDFLLVLFQILHWLRAKNMNYLVDIVNYWSLQSETSSAKEKKIQTLYLLDELTRTEQIVDFVCICTVLDHRWGLLACEEQNICNKKV